MLPPKRRFKLNEEFARKINIAEPPATTTKPPWRPPRMKRSGRLPLQWRKAAEFYPPGPELPPALTLHELVGLFMQVCIRPTHSHHSTSVPAH
jgi:hypothetical protein